MNSARGLRLGLDLDGVVADYVAALRDAAKRIGVGQGLDGAPTTWGMVEPGWFDNKDQWLAAHTDVFRTGAHTIPLLDAHAPSALTGFHDAGGVIVVTTARSGIPDSDVTHEKVFQDTARWLAQHAIPFDDMMFTHDKSLAGCDLYIDDSPGVVQHLMDSGKKVVVRDQLYNRHVDAEHRVSSVSEMMDLLSSGLLSPEELAG